MKISILQQVFHKGVFNFWLTNRIPRRALTLFFGWFSRLEHPLIARLSIAIWRFFADDLHLEDAKKTTFHSLHDCFIRELKDQARPIDTHPSIVVSPCDAIVGAMGSIRQTELIQAKGFPYTLEDLLSNPQLVERYRNGRYVTLRLKSSMYHRFHAPCDCQIREINYISGDVWNVNPSALQRIERLYCKNERNHPIGDSSIGTSDHLSPGSRDFSRQHPPQLLERSPQSQIPGFESNRL
jgi:phosphatidylserine decarboxylase